MHKYRRKKKQEMDNIGLFCSASDSISPLYMQKASEFGAWLGLHGKRLIYGGSSTGLMEAVARSAKEHGAMIMGVVPSILDDRGMVSLLLDVTFRSVNLSDRKDIMLQESDVLVAFPGGVGTLDEIFHVMASATIGYHSKKIIFYNVDGFWDDLLQFLQKLEESRFAHAPLQQYYSVANSFEQLTVLLER